MSDLIIEKKLGIPSDYQYKAINSKNFWQANWHRNKLTVVDALVSITPESRILDLGTGSGNFEFEFATRCKEIVGVDYNDEAIAFLKSRLQDLNLDNVSLHVADIRTVDTTLDIGKFDLIVMIDVIEHLPIQDSTRVVSNLKSLLNPNGKLLIITPNYKSPWVLIEWFLDLVTFVPKFAGSQHLAKFHKTNTQKILQDLGYEVNTIGSFNMLSFLFPSRRLSKLLCSLELKFFGCFANLLVVECASKDSK